MTEENEERAACVCGSEDAPGLGHCSGCEVYWQGRKKAEDDAERVGQLEAALRPFAALDPNEFYVGYLEIEEAVVAARVLLDDGASKPLTKEEA